MASICAYRTPYLCGALADQLCVGDGRQIARVEGDSRPAHHDDVEIA